MSVFTVRDLHVAFRSPGTLSEPRSVVRGLDLSLEAGQTVALVGESGSGKSVSLLAATGLLDPDRVVVSGRAALRSHDGTVTDLVAAGPREVRRLRGREVGFVFQDPQANLHPLKTVGRQLAEAVGAHESLSRADRRRRVLDLLDEVGIAEPQRRMHDHPVHFSGGMRQRVMIAMAIAHRPALLVADEPTTALDVTVQAAVLDLLARLQREHAMALLLVSHDLAVVSDVADEIVVLRHGQVVERGLARELCRSPRQDYTRELLRAARPQISVVHRAPVSDATDARANAPVPVGLTPRAAGPTPVLTVRELSHDYDPRARTPRPAVRGVDFDLWPAEILGLVGESGSGKSTIGRVVAGLLRPTEGRVRLGEAEWGAAPGLRGVVTQIPGQARSRVQVVFQDPYASLNPRHRIRDILAEPFRVQSELINSDLDHEVAALASAVELDAALLDRRPAHLSGGQRQRVAIARALALRPDVIVADEAVSALDVTTRAQILDLFARLRAERGTSVLFISHDLGVVRALCDRVLVLQHGLVVESGVTAHVFDRPAHPYTRALVAAVPGRRGLLEPVRAEEAVGA